MAERVLVIGGSRGTGRLIAERLSPAGYSARVLTRDPERARAVLPAGIEVVGGDLTRPDTLPPALADVAHVITTAGVTGGLTREAVVRATVYDGTRNLLDAMRDAGTPGRFLFMTAVGLSQPSPLALLLDQIKRNIRQWRRLAEEEIRAADRDHVILRAGMLTPGPPGQRAIQIVSEEPPLTFQGRIRRADVAEVFVAVLPLVAVRGVTLNLIGGPPPASEDWRETLRSLRPNE